VPLYIIDWDILQSAGFLRKQPFPIVPYESGGKKLDGGTGGIGMDG
jgi:hypothetical protein